MEIPFTPLEFARRARKLYADRTAVIDGSMRLTYRQFLDRCDRWSAALARMGVARGDRVAYIAPNTHSNLEGYYAVPQLGAAIVPINYRLVADDFAYIIEHSGAKVVCAHADYIAAVDSIRPMLKGVTHFVALSGTAPGWINYEATLAQTSPDFDRPEPVESDVISINYTSGTTARPKGVMLTHRNVWTNSVGALVHVHMTCEDRYLWTLPMFHVNGWSFVWTVTAVGGTHICIPKADARSVFDAAIQHGANFLCAAPTVLIGIASAPEEARNGVPRGVRVLTAGAPPAATTIERVEKDLGWEITQVYGLTEVSPLISICEPRPEHRNLSAQERAVIKARQGVEIITSADIRVFDPEGDEVPWDGKSLGEIVVRGNVVMAGYYRDKANTDKAMAGGWFHTGDAAVVHPDGYIEIRDRFKDVIISGGENISSIEVEGLILSHPAVMEVAVVGLPDERWGESPHAFVVLRSGATITEEELRSFAKARLAGFKVPKSFRFVQELPKTATGKIQKYVLRGGRANVAAQ
jgi:fatty-acyl-CoA synthase